jgi:hypothetical protein
MEIIKIETNYFPEIYLNLFPLASFPKVKSFGYIVFIRVNTLELHFLKINLSRNPPYQLP